MDARRSGNGLDPARLPTCTNPRRCKLRNLDLAFCPLIFVLLAIAVTGNPPNPPLVARVIVGTKHLRLINLLGATAGDRDGKHMLFDRDDLN